MGRSKTQVTDRPSIRPYNRANILQDEENLAAILEEFERFVMESGSPTLRWHLARLKYAFKRLKGRIERKE